MEEEAKIMVDSRGRTTDERLALLKKLQERRSQRNPEEINTAREELAELTEALDHAAPPLHDSAQTSKASLHIAEWIYDLIRRQQSEHAEAKQSREAPEPAFVAEVIRLLQKDVSYTVKELMDVYADDPDKAKALVERKHRKFKSE
jgi:hypothetical protein